MHIQKLNYMGINHDMSTIAFCKWNKLLISTDGPLFRQCICILNEKTNKMQQKACFECVTHTHGFVHYGAYLSIDKSYFLYFICEDCRIFCWV